MRHNGERRPEEIEAEIERTRADMDATLSAIENRLTPGQLVDQGLDYLRHSGGNEFLANLNESVKQNPLPVALVGLGVAWLMASGRHPAGPASASWSEHRHAATERVSDAATAAGEKLSGAAATAGEKLGATAHAARESMSHAASAARERASHLSETTHRQWERARGSYEHLLHEQPLVLGAAGLALGALLAAAVPRTRQEEALLGRAAGGETDRSAEPGSTAAGPHASTSEWSASDTTPRHSAPGHEMVGGSADRVACPASDAPTASPTRRTNPGMDV